MSCEIGQGGGRSFVYSRFQKLVHFAYPSVCIIPAFKLAPSGIVDVALDYVNEYLRPIYEKAQRKRLRNR